MQAKLIIFLEVDPNSTPIWVSVDSSGNATSPSTENLGMNVEDKEVIVVAPAQDILLTSANLPKMPRSRLLQALPFAVEEQLIDDVDHLHFAAGELEANGNLHVAITAKEKIQQWLNTLRTLSIHPDSLVSANACLPIAPNTWQVMIKEEVVIVRTHVSQGFACDRINFSSLLNTAITANTTLPECVYVYNYTETPCAQELGLQIQLKEEFLKPEQFHADCARNVAKAPGINLLQGAFATRKTRLPHKEKLLKISYFIAALSVILLFINPMVSYFILKQRVDSLDVQINNIYKRNFPQSSSVVAPKARMEDKLRKLSADIGENRFLQLLAFLGKNSKLAPDVKLTRIDFQNNQLTLELIAGSSEEFSRFTDFLQAQGLSVKQQNANLSGTRITASLLIE